MSRTLSRRQKSLLIRLGLALLGALVMAVFIFVTGNLTLLENPKQAALFGGLLYLSALIPFVAKRDLPMPQLFFAALITAAFVFLRICLFHQKAGDYLGYLHPWVKKMQTFSLAEAIRTPIGNYNLPYVYLLAAISRLGGLNDLYAIKFVSCLFDVLAACSVAGILSRFTERWELRAASYLAVLVCPTVFLNSACWSQCDSMYTSLCLCMVYCLLCRRGRAAVILWSVAFTLKLQAVFALPVLVIEFFRKRIRLREALWFPAVFICSLLPALLCGRSLGDCVDIYYNQVANYPDPSLVQNVSSLWSLLGPSYQLKPYTLMALFLAAGIALSLFCLCLYWREGFTEKLLVEAFFLWALALPFLLPKMHDRYFYLADVSSLLVFFLDRKKWYVPLITVLTSYNVYQSYLMGDHLLFPISWGAMVLLALLVFLLRGFFQRLRQSAEQTGSPPLPNV